MSVLYGRASDSILLADALKIWQAFQGKQEAIGLFYSPQTCALASIIQGKVRDATGRALASIVQGTVSDAMGQEVAELSNCFEARIFNETAELRWLNHTGGSGRAVLLSEQPIDPQYGDTELPALEFLKVLSQQYLLWGEGVENATSTRSPVSGWSRLSTARIGKLDVPVSGIKEKQRVVLKVREYLQAEQDYGNVFVAEERLIGLAPLGVES